MASVTVNLTGYFEIVGARVQWDDDVLLGSAFSAEGNPQTLDQIQLYDNGNAAISIVGINNRFTPVFEATGRIIVEASDGEALEIMIANADMTEVYFWTPTNSAEVTAFAIHVRGLTDHNATFTLTDGAVVNTIPRSSRCADARGQRY